MGGIWIIANPNAGRGRGERILTRLEEGLSRRGADYALHRTEAPGHAGILAKEAAAAGASRLLVVGGDGTIHEVASGLLGDGGPPAGVRRPALAVLPVGTGNDFHRMVRAPGDVEAVTRALLDGVSRGFEVGRVSWNGGNSHFVNLIGVGLDVEVLRRRTRFKKLAGLLQYLAALGDALRHLKPVPVRLTVHSPGEPTFELDEPVLLCAVTVGPSIGGGFILSPGARPDDGFLDAFAVERLGVARVLRYLPGILAGSTAERRGIWRRQGARIEIEAAGGSGGFAFELDGELVDTPTSRLEIRCVPDALEVLELPEES